MEVRSEFENKETIFATKKDIATMKAELIKWMFIFWIGQLAAFIGVAQFILK